MVRGVFVTGTDTGVGKTVVCAALLHRYRALSVLRYWKPIQTGIDQDDDTAEVLRLSDAPSNRALLRGVRLHQPLSPHQAAQLEGRTIDPDALMDTLHDEAPASWVIEGAGGLLVPVNGSTLMADLMALLNRPVVVVARSTLGTINHTLLTLEALRHRQLSVTGVVMVGTPNPDNRRDIEHYGQVSVIGEMPPFDPLTSRAVRDWADGCLDPTSSLAVHM